MPIYEYRCPTCLAHFERLVGYDDPTPKCPHCGDANASRLISRPSSVGRSEPVSYG